MAADDLLAAGYTAEQALEVVTRVAYTTIANPAAGVAGTPVDAAFEGYAWAAADEPPGQRAAFELSAAARSRALGGAPRRPPRRCGS